MSAESQAIFHEALYGGADAETLRAAAVGHLGASRSLQELTGQYAQALDAGEHEAAQRIADELAPVRAAGQIAAGGVPHRMD